MSAEFDAAETTFADVFGPPKFLLEVGFFNLIFTVRFNASASVASDCCERDRNNGDKVSLGIRLAFRNRLRGGRLGLRGATEPKMPDDARYYLNRSSQD